MKNLKKVLALGLALVMLLGMFTVAAAAETEEKKMVASDLTDFDTVADGHKDAVSLAVDLEIIKGIKQDDGKYAFKPADPIDRASWAKMVYIAREGSDDASLYEGNTSGIKDIEGNWAEGYISYLAGMKYISGDNNGNYSPSSTITVAAAYKMMLTILGFDAEDRGYQNDSAWMANIMRDAKKNGLTNGVDASMTAAVNLTRENAAQILCNTLNTRLREANYGRDNGEKYVTSYSNLLYTLGYDSFRLIKVTARVNELNDDGFAVLGDCSAYGVGINNNTGKKVINETVKASTKNVAQDVTIYAKGELGPNDAGTEIASVELKELVSTSLAAATSNVIEVVTDGVADFDKAFTKGDDAFVAEANTTGEGAAATVNVTYYLNGDEADGVDGAPTAAAAKAEAAKAGNVVEFIDNTDDGLVDTVKITTYTVGEATADPEIATKSGKEKVRIQGVLNNAWIETSKINGYASIKKGDVVLVSGNNVSYTLEKADKVSGKVTSKANKGDGTITVGGKAYGATGIGGNNINDFTTPDNSILMKDWDNDYTNEFDFYLDKNGTVCYIIQITEETKADVAFVLRSAWVEGSSNLSGTTKGYGEVELLFTDGTSEIVKVVKVKKVDSEDGKEKAMDVIEADVKREQDSDGTWNAGAMGQKFVEVSEGTNGYTVKVMATGTDSFTGEVVAKPNFAVSKTSLVADNKTIFLVGKGPDSDGNYDYAAYTGYANVPATVGSAGGKTYNTASSGAVDYVYLTTEGFKGEISDGYVYIKDVTDFSTDSKSNMIFSVVDAEGDAESTLTVTEDVEGLDGNGFYKITSVTEDGIVKKVEKKEAAENVTVCANTVFKVGENTYSYDSTTVFVAVDVKNDGSFVEVSATSPDGLNISTDSEDAEYFESVTALVIDSDGLASYIYVIRKAPAAAAE